MKRKFKIIILGLVAILSTIGSSVGIFIGLDVSYAESKSMTEDNDKEDGMTSDLEGGMGDDLGDELEEVSDRIPRFYIKAINPGYKIDGVNNVGEMIEIGRIDSDTPISLAGAAVGYTNSSGNYSTLYEFPENSWMAGETILLRLASSPGSELAAAQYTKTMAMSASLKLLVDGEVMDEVCWTGKKDCYKAFSSAKPTTLVRNMKTGDFEHKTIYDPEFNEKNYYVIKEDEDGAGKDASFEKRCNGLQFSEILSYYDASKTEQFVEVFNAGSEQVLLDGCKVRYKNKNHILSGIVEAEGYFAYYPAGFSLTKNPTNSNKLEILDTDGTVVDTMEYPNGQRRGTAYAMIGTDVGGEEIWKTTYAPTPGAPNNYQEFKTCESGKVINKATGNCVKATSISEKICKEGYYLNILTGRCNKKKDASKTEAKTCKEGYYLNPLTNRCKKIVDNKGADYELKPESYEENSTFVALYAVLAVLGVGVIYLIYEFRQEIRKLWRKVFRRVR